MERNTRTTFQGVVTSTKNDKTITVVIETKRNHPLYGKRVGYSTKIRAHDENNVAEVGDTVTVMACRPMSATKRFRLVSVDKKAQTIVKRLKTLEDVGLGYIKLGQNSSTLSGGENQRVKLAYYIGQEKQEPTLFIFDEPTTGLHFHDIERLLQAFNALIERGHTILIIEHNMEIIKMADHIIDIGPDGGDRGGELVACGTPEEIVKNERSITGKYLKSKL